MQLYTLSILLGVVTMAKAVWALAYPDKFRASAKRIPRSTTLGYVTVAIGTAWFLYIFENESLADFAAYKTLLRGGFILLAVLVCMFVKDYLAVRGMAIILLLLAKSTVEMARIVETDWRLLLVAIAYVWVVVGMWFTVSPWRARDLLEWATANDGRIKTMAIARVGLAALLLVLGLTVFRTSASP